MTAPARQPPILLAKAWERLLSAVEPLEPERVPVERAVGRYLSESVPARRTQPAADLSAMDGYALCTGDDTGPWTVVGESAAGHPFPKTLRPGQAIRISTGALMPQGAGCVLLQENATRDGDRLSLNGEGMPSPRHVRRRGFDFTAGAPVLPAAMRMGPGQLALAISAGHGTLPVRRLPRVAVLDSGDELAADPENCAAHQIPASNGAMLSAMIAPYAGAVRRIGPVADSMHALAAALADASDMDVLVTSGGASVGDHDLIRPALEAWGATIDFWKVAIRPGKPIMVARRGRQWIIGLPGNPVSSYVTAFLFVLPLLRALAGASHADVLPLAQQATLAAPLPPTGDRQEFLRAQLRGDAMLHPIGEQDSSALAALAMANVLIDRKPGSPATPAGHSVWYYSIENGGIA